MCICQRRSVVYTVHVRYIWRRAGWLAGRTGSSAVLGRGSVGSPPVATTRRPWTPSQPAGRDPLTSRRPGSHKHGSILASTRCSPARGLSLQRRHIATCAPRFTRTGRKLISCLSPPCLLQVYVAAGIPSRQNASLGPFYFRLRATSGYWPSSHRLG